MFIKGFKKLLVCGSNSVEMKVRVFLYSYFWSILSWMLWKKPHRRGKKMNIF